MNFQRNFIICNKINEFLTKLSDFQQIIMIIKSFLVTEKKTKYLHNRIFIEKKLSSFDEISAELISHSLTMLKIH